MKNRSKQRLKSACISYADADWAGGADRRSTSGHLIFLGDTPIYWSSRTQHSVSLSSTEAEYYSISELSKEVVYYRTFLTEVAKMGGRVPEMNKPIVIYEDNNSCIDLIHNENDTKRTKHIDVRYHHIRQLCAEGVISVVHTGTLDQLADLLPKPDLSMERSKTLADRINRGK